MFSGDFPSAAHFQVDGIWGTKELLVGQDALPAPAAPLIVIKKIDKS